MLWAPSSSRPGRSVWSRHVLVRRRARPPDRGRAQEAPPYRSDRRVARQPRRVVRLVRLRQFRDLLRRLLLPRRQSDHAADEHRRDLRGRLPDAPRRRMGPRPRRRPARAQERAHPHRHHDVGGRPADRRGPDLRPGRVLRRAGAAAGAAAPGHEHRRRVRGQRHLPHRGVGPQPARAGLVLPVRVDDLRPAPRARHPDHDAAHAHHGPAGELGLADPLPPRGAVRGGRLLAAQEAPGDGRVQGGAVGRGGRPRRQRARIDEGPVAAPAAGGPGDGAHPRRHRRVLHVHHLPHQVPGRQRGDGQDDRHPGQFHRPGPLRRPPALRRDAVRPDRA